MRELEKSQRLTQSILWDLQHLAYSEFGPSAWTNKGVPFYLTSNPLIAKQFSSMILAYLRDNLKNKSFDFAEPFYIFDLGAGTGRLGYLILKQLIPMIKDLISSDLKICYVMTDFTEKNITSCRSHPLLNQFIETGNLDFALYHHSQQQPLHLICQDRILNNVINPIALVCTYYFDTIPQDFFRVKNGFLEEGRISISLPYREGQGKLLPEMITNLVSSYDYVPIDNPMNYYPERPEFNALLQEYTMLFNETSFLFPIGSLESLRFFSQLSNHRLLLLAGDQGVVTEKQVHDWGEPKICRHATFSMPVSYHLLSKYFQNQDGIGLLTTFPNTKYVVMSGILKKDTEKFCNTEMTFSREIDSFEPIEYWQLTDLKPATFAELSLENLLLYIKLGSWDPINFNYYFPEILKKLPAASSEEKDYLKKTIKHIWDNFYQVDPEEGKCIMNLGVLMFEMKMYDEALFFFQKALETQPDNKDLLNNIAVCKRIKKDSL